MKVSVAAAEGGGGGRSSWSLFGYEVNESWEGRKEGRMGPFFHGLLARRRAEVKGGKRSAAAEREREKQRDEVQKLRPRLLQGRADGRTEDAVFGLGRPRRLWLWLWVEQAEEGDRGVSE